MAVSVSNSVSKSPVLQAAAPVAAAGSAEVLKLIRGWKWFIYVPEEAQQWLAERALIREIAAGKTMYAAGDPAEQVYGVISGVFRLFMSSPRGDEITLEEVVSGGWFPHVIRKQPLTFYGNCVCQQNAKVAILSQAVMSEFGRRWPAYFQGLYEELIDRGVVTVGRIELLTLHNLNVRLAVYLLRMAKLYGRVEPGGTVWVAAGHNQTEVGARVGGTRQRVNAVLKQWTKKALIESHKDGVRILDVARLTAEARKSGFELAEYLAGWHGGWQGKN